MRTTLALDDDVFALTHQWAQRERTSLDEAVSRYVREAMRAQPANTIATGSSRSKYPSCPCGGKLSPPSTCAA